MSKLIRMSLVRVAIEVQKEMESNGLENPRKS